MTSPHISHPLPSEHTLLSSDALPSHLFTSTPLNWAFLGCGAIAHRMARVFALTARPIWGVATRTRSHAEAFSVRYEVPHPYDSFEELCADPKVEAVYVATPSHTHAGYIERLLIAGKHVLCTTPLALSADELVSLESLATQHNCVLMESASVLHMPLYYTLARRVERGEFGALSLVNISCGSFKGYGDLSSRFYDPARGGGALSELGIPALLLAARFMTDKPSDVCGLVVSAPTDADVTSAFVLRNPSGQLGILSLSLHAPQPERAVLSFEKCVVEIDTYSHADTAALVWTLDGRHEMLRQGESAYALCYTLADFEAAVDGDTRGNDMFACSITALDAADMLRRACGMTKFSTRTQCGGV